MRVLEDPEEQVEHDPPPQVISGARSWMPWTLAMELVAHQPSGDPIPYSTLVKVARPGDVLLWSANNLPAFIQRFFTDSTYSHVSTIAFSEEGVPLSVESTLHEHGMVDLISGREKSGPMTVPLHRRLEESLRKYDWRVVYRPLDPHRDDTPEEFKARNDAILRLMRQKADWTFDMNVPNLMSAASRELRVFPYCWMPDKESFRAPRKQFCASLVAEILQLPEFGVLDTVRHSISYSPNNFSEVNQSLRLTPGHGYGIESQIILDA